MVHVRKSANFNPLAPRGARPTTNEKYAPTDDFNPLAPCGARRGQWTRPWRMLRISIHSPLAGRDPCLRLKMHGITIFQSTRPSRGETDTPTFQTPGRTDFNPLAPRGARQKQPFCPLVDTHFNPLAPRGARRAGTARAWDARLFQSTRPSRGETVWEVPAPKKCRNFNPLAPRGARPACGQAATKRRKYFNPLAPRGASPCSIWSSSCRKTFQSTRPSRGETAGRPGAAGVAGISIHSPLAGRDVFCCGVY